MKKNEPERKSSRCFPLTDPIQAYLEIRKTHDAIHRHVSKELAQWGLSIPKYGVMMRLYDHDELYLSELSNLIFRGNSNITTLINRLERDGLVERFNGEDRRVKKIRLTPKGQKLIPKVISEYRAFLHQMIAKNLSPKEQKNLMELLEKVQKSIQCKIAV
jgi:DNA-binding MarR family transcriptional regulator